MQPSKPIARQRPTYLTEDSIEITDGDMEGRVTRWQTVGLWPNEAHGGIGLGAFAAVAPDSNRERGTQGALRVKKQPFADCFSPDALPRALRRIGIRRYVG